jgi:hypothetical protein
LSLSTPRHDVFAGTDSPRGQQPDLTIDNLDVLDHHHRIGTGGDRRAGHDLPCNTMRQGAGWSFAGMRGTFDRQECMTRCFCRATGISIASGAGKGRLVPIGMNRMSQYAAGGVTQLNTLD